MIYNLQQRFLLLFIVAVTVSAYFNSLNSEKFLIDDISVIEEFIQNDYTLYDMVRVDKGRTYKSFYDASYRPLFGLSLWVDFSLWFDGTRGYHLTNLFIHVLNVLLVFFLSKKIWEGRDDVVLICFISALIFSVHPIHTEAVNWINGRQDPMATFFTGSSLLVYLKWKDWRDIKAIGYPAVMSLVFLLGLLSREMTFALIPILVIYEITSLVYLKEKKEFSGISKLAVILPVLIVIVILFNMLQHQFASNYQSSPRFAAFENYLAETGILRICYENTAYLGYYLLKLFLPVPLNYSATGIYLPFYFVFALLAVPLMFFLVRKERVLLFLLTASILSILPNLPARFFSWTVVAERYLYLPSVFFSTGAGFLISKFLYPVHQEGSRFILDGKYLRAVIAGAIFVLMTTLTVERNWQWNSNYRFWQNAVKKNPDSPAVILKYAGVLGGNYVTFRGQEENKSLLKHAPLIKPAELIPGNGYEMVEKVVSRAERLGDKGGYLVLASMAKADKDPEKLTSYLDRLDPGGLDGGVLLTYSMMWVYLSKNPGEDRTLEKEHLLKAIKYLRRYLLFKKRDDSNALKLARLYTRVSMYREAAATIDKLLITTDLPFIQRKAALRMRKKIGFELQKIQGGQERVYER